MLRLQIYERISSRQLSRFGNAEFHQYLTSILCQSRFYVRAEVSVNFINKPVIFFSRGIEIILYPSAMKRINK
jgi:hypothetical protein